MGSLVQLTLHLFIHTKITVGFDVTPQNIVIINLNYLEKFSEINSKLSKGNFPFLVIKLKIYIFFSKISI